MASRPDAFESGYHPDSPPGDGSFFSNVVTNKMEEARLRDSLQEKAEADRRACRPPADGPASSKRIRQTLGLSLPRSINATPDHIGSPFESSQQDEPAPALADTGPEGLGQITAIDKPIKNRGKNPNRRPRGHRSFQCYGNGFK